MELTDLNQETINTKYKPLSPWGIWGLVVLSSIPVLGLIGLLLFLFSSESVNMKNLIKALIIVQVILCVSIIILIFALSAGVLIFIDGLNMAEIFENFSDFI